MRAMRRSPHRAVLSEAITAATARFQADLRRLARTVLRDELPRILATVEPVPRPIVVGVHALHVEPAARRQTSPVPVPRKPAATARGATTVQTSRPAAAARTSKPAAAAGPPVERAAARAERPTVKPVPAVAGRREGPAVAIAEPKQELAPTVAEVEQRSAGPHAELASVAESVPASTNAKVSWPEGARARRDEPAQRRQERQDNARNRRAAATAMRAEPVAMPRTSAAPATAVRGEPMTTVVHEELPGTNGTRTMDRRIQSGTVKWFSEAKGYGFVRADDGTDAFVHRTAISGEGFRTLTEGQTVSYEEVEGPKGLLAVNVVPLI